MRVLGRGPRALYPAPETWHKKDQGRVTDGKHHLERMIKRHKMVWAVEFELMDA